MNAPEDQLPYGEVIVSETEVSPASPELIRLVLEGWRLTLQKKDAEEGLKKVNACAQ
jgi:hypothetical protein